MDEEGRGRLLAVGMVQTSHGLKGYVKVKSLSGEIEHLLRLKSVHLGVPGALVTFEVENVRRGAGAVLLKLVGIDSPESAAGYRGQFIWVERRFASVLAEEEYYSADLEGCRLYQEGDLIGTVVAVPAGGGGDFLEVESPEGKRLIVPFTKHFVGRVDIVERRIELTEAYEQP
jgi:16S rRNA processing protein RimM